MVLVWSRLSRGEPLFTRIPVALVGASNFFELAVATAIGLFGFELGAALAAVVGVLIEVPLLLSVAMVINHGKDWTDRGGAPLA